MNSEFHSRLKRVLATSCLIHFKTAQIVFLARDQEMDMKRRERRAAVWSKFSDL